MLTVSEIQSVTALVIALIGAVVTVANAALSAWQEIRLRANEKATAANTAVIQGAAETPTNDDTNLGSKP